jgi:hypothetical protein
MLAGPAYVEWTDAKVLLQRHKKPQARAGESQAFL